MEYDLSTDDLDTIMVELNYVVVASRNEKKENEYVVEQITDLRNVVKEYCPDSWYHREYINHKEEDEFMNLCNRVKESPGYDHREKIVGDFTSKLITNIYNLEIEE